MSERPRFADFHQDTINPKLAEILDNPEMSHARERDKQLPKEGLRKVDLVFSSIYRRASKEVKEAALQGDKNTLAMLRAETARIINYYSCTKDFRIIEKYEDLQLEEDYDANNIILHLEGGDIIDSPIIVDELFKRGVRSIGPLYSHDNLLGGGAGGNKNRGLTSLGKKAIDRMVKLGMVIDISHANRRTANDILERVRGYEKAVATHTAPGTSQRTISPELIKKIVERGGVIGFTPATPFFPTFEKFIDELKRTSDSIGSTQHLAIGTDFGGLDAAHLFKEFDDIGKLAIIAEQLSERGGLSDEEIAKIMYGNVERVVKKL